MIRWDKNPMHWERSKAIAKAFLKLVPVKPEMNALEYGAGTGILSFLLAGKFSEITLMDNSTQMVQVMAEKLHSQYSTEILFDAKYWRIPGDC